MTTSSHCNTGRTCLSLPIATRENTYLAVHVGQKITITRRRKSENSRFEIWYSVVAPSGGAEKKLNMGAQLQIIPYKKPPFF